MTLYDPDAPTLYTTYYEAVYREIIEPLKNGDATLPEPTADAVDAAYDIDAIADELIVDVPHTIHAATGMEIANSGGFALTECTHDTFWDTVMRHAR